MEFSFTGNTKPCTWGRTTLSMLAGKGLGRESPEGPGGHQAGPEPALCSEKQWVNSPLGCVRQSQGAEEVACPLHVALVTHPECCAPQDRRHGLAGATPAKVTKRQKLEELLSLAGRGSTRI